ncbi:ATPase AAA-2 domain protein [Spirochaeta thermophila DSM 6578]|uniref:ATPase AAA-2 domain protein n=1 Tax=Winmispira thermophila (strain ATCC 700085 / DSM 6578 / Z-1203) TaxID=869211 RepID=G0GFC7_WINT7|nr:ATP-dependent Clp protease ATP-binding subunit [Spirochaeta thermophila]AEJ61541.1 ATPase AAA-2 domain protein [Spirochaeta thermophila DSM 6578]
MFKDLTQRAQKILTVLAQDEAKRFHAEELEPEHIILAIIREGAGVAYRAIKRLKIAPEEIQVFVEKNLSKQRGSFILGDVPLSSRSRRVLEYAAEEARHLDDEYIGTEHLMLGCARDGEGVFTRFLAQKGIDLEVLREAILEVKGSESVYNSSWGGKEEQEKRRGAFQSAAYRKNTPLLDEFSRDLTELARTGKLDPVIGRERELRRIVQILARRTKNNPVLIGDPGVGKTAIVEALAQRIVRGEVPEMLEGKRILVLDLAALVAGTKYRGEFEERLKRVMREIVSVKNVVLFIDELHTIIGAGGAEGAIDASNMLKPALSRGEIQCIGATTLDEYRKYIEKDAALERRFQPVYVREPTIEETIQILEGIKTRYEDFHNVTYTRKAVEAAVVLSARYITERHLPDKAIDLLDEAGSRTHVQVLNRPQEIEELEKKIDQLNSEKIMLVNTQNYERAAAVRDQVNRLKMELERLKTAWKLEIKRTQNIVDQEDIQEVVSDITGIPLVRIAQSESERLLHIEEELHRKVISQDEAIKVVASAIRRARTGLSSPNRPMGSFVFLGPTGVGKTLLAKTLAEYLFGDTSALIRLDMSDFMEKHNVSRLVGAPPGYVGYEEGGLLTEKVRHRPYSVILFDEIEKAHPDVFNILLQILEEGELQDNLGHRVSFRNAVLIMTSNAGAREITRESTVGFQTKEGILDFREIQASAMNELRRIFRPEFLNRIDEIVVFKSLSRADLERILGLLLEEVFQRVREQGMEIEITKRAREYLLDKGYDPRYGARPLRRTIQRELEDPLSMEILRQRFVPGSYILVTVRSGKLVFQQKQTKKPPEKVTVETR